MRASKKRVEIIANLANISHPVSYEHCSLNSGVHNTRCLIEIVERTDELKHGRVAVSVNYLLSPSMVEIN